ncbi:hypothetical protein OOZ15_00295 [Galbibacter sp. EGI 63066]|uniref:terpene synthase family protein n=1 Tax=Galbibacter sp. EGI 63066 TaxID=2993559 RepID=UPI0022492718|nr:hypothetical protein [Galbibacter sp. EGI 63066]MCX2678368.1 hypothetical protein [Galbibacter sp. EGI 63066]
MKAPDHITSRLIYPYPFLKNPLAEKAQKHVEDFLIDIEYRELGYQENVLKSFKGTKTAYIAGWWFPTVSYERLLVLSRFMTWTMAHDDIFEQRSESRVKEAAEEVVAILKGQMMPHETDYILGGQLYRLRRGLLYYMSEKAVAHFADMVDFYMQGVAMESKYRNGGVWPTAEEVIRVRSQSICMRPFYALLPVEMKVELPEEILSHPDIVKLELLAGNAIARYNDAESYFKDLDNEEGKYLNLLTVMMHHNNWTEEEAVEELIKIFNEHNREFRELQFSLPDFGDEWNEHVGNYVNYVSMTATGWKRCSFYELKRYSYGGWVASPDYLEIEDNFRERSKVKKTN